jgi:hypothetical protein
MSPSSHVQWMSPATHPEHLQQPLPAVDVCVGPLVRWLQEPMKSAKFRHESKFPGWTRRSFTARETCGLTAGVLKVSKR